MPILVRSIRSIFRCVRTWSMHKSMGSPLGPGRIPSSQMWLIMTKICLSHAMTSSYDIATSSSRIVVPLRDSMRRRRIFPWLGQLMIPMMWKAIPRRTNAPSSERMHLWTGVSSLVFSVMSSASLPSSSANPGASGRCDLCYKSSITTSWSRVGQCLGWR